MGRDLKKKPLSNKVKALLSVLLMIIFVASCLVIVYLYNDYNKTEGTVEPTEITQPAVIEKVKGVNESVTLLNNLIKKAEDKSFAKSDISTSVYFSDMEYSGTENEKTLVSFLSDKYLPAITRKYENANDKFGSDNVIFAPVISENDIVKVENRIDEENEDIYKIEISYSENASFYGSEDDKVAFKEIKKESSSVFNVNNSDISLSEAIIIANVNIKTGLIERIEFSRQYNVSLEMQFTGDYSSVGVKKLSTVYGVTTVYNLSYVSVTFPEKVKYIEMGESFSVNAQTKMEEDSEYELILTSSDESVLSIGEDGYAKGISESPECVTITASFKYLGKEYKDTCKVFVINPVKKVVTDIKVKTLNKGEAFKLNAVITPDDATINTVKWYTENENIATVDETGTVTAVGEGTVKVFCVTDNGYFRASCVVTVN